MSDTDSFIEEVSEEVRRDRLFAMMRRYGWVAIAAILLIVGGAAYNEYRKAQITSQAQAMGNAILGALESNDAAERAKALEAIDTSEPGAEAVVGLLLSKEQFAVGDVDKAKATLDSIANNSAAPLAYRQVATFKLLGMQAGELSAQERRAGYQALIGGNPQLRLMAEEQLALIDIEEGKSEEAIAALQAIVQDAEATAAMRRRGTQLIVALGGALPGTGSAEQTDGS